MSLPLAAPLLPVNQNANIFVPIFEFRISNFVLTGLISCLLALVACGSPTAPTPPSRHIPEAAGDLSARQMGEAVVLSFTLPRRTTDGKAVGRNLQILLYRQFRKEELPPPPAMLAQARRGGAAEAAGEDLGQRLFGDAKPIVEWAGGDLERLAAGQMAQYSDRIAVADLKAHSGEWAVYGVLARNKKGRSAGFSNLIALRIYPAPAPPGNFLARNVEAGVELSWTPPSETTSGTAIASAGPFPIYRSTPGEKEEWELLAEAANSPWTDTATEYGKTYRYTIRAVARYGPDLVESDASARLTITPQDIFPPKAPEGLVGVPILAAFGGPAIELSWQPNTEADLAGYNIYRSEPPKPRDGGGYQRRNAKLIPGPAYRDDTVEAGKTYSYAVAAVDRAGNESEPSAEATASVPAEQQP